MIEVVKTSVHPFPEPLVEGISLDIHSTFIEPPSTSDTEMKVGSLLSFHSPYPSGKGERTKCSSIFSASDFSHPHINIPYSNSKMGQVTVFGQF